MILAELIYKTMIVVIVMTSIDIVIREKKLFLMVIRFMIVCKISSYF